MLKKLISQLRGEINLQKLVNRGLVVGRNFKMMGQCIIDPSHCWHIRIGDNVTFAPKVHVLAHDTSTKYFTGYTKVSNVTIGNNVFIGAGSILLPGVTIGDNVIVGAGSIVTKNVDSNCVIAGNPAKIISSLDDYIKKIKEGLKDENCFGNEYTLRNKNFKVQHKKELLNTLTKFNSIYVE